MSFIRPGDIVLLFLLLVFAVFSIMESIGEVKETKFVLIKTPYKTYRYKLNEDRQIEVEGFLGKSIIKIDKEGARFISSSCPNQNCVHEGSLKITPIVCLPNGVSISYDIKPKYDSLSR